MSEYNKKEAIKECNRLVEIGVLIRKKIKGKYYYADSELSLIIDRLSPRNAFMTGYEKGTKDASGGLSE